MDMRQRLDELTSPRGTEQGFGAVREHATAISGPPRSNTIASDLDNAEDDGRDDIHGTFGNDGDAHGSAVMDLSQLSLPEALQSTHGTSEGKAPKPSFYHSRPPSRAPSLADHNAALVLEVTLYSQQ